MSVDRQAMRDILEGEQLPPSVPVSAMCAKIRAQHAGRVLGFIYYGSSLRAMNDPSKMLDFYVLVDSYRKTHKNPLRALLNALIPPAVYYLENENEDGSLSTCKYSLLSLNAFERRCTKKSFLSQVWGRFSQPCIVLFTKDERVKSRIQNARIQAVLHMAEETRPLMDSPVEAVEFWSRGFRESYRTELRPESSEERSREIVSRYQERYQGLLEALYGAPDKAGLFALPAMTSLSHIWTKWKWFWRRVLGKIVAAIRVLNSAATFSGGLDYALHKLKSHSGVTIEVTEHQRRHPVLWSPVLAWKLWRKGAFR